MTSAVDDAVEALPPRGHRSRRKRWIAFAAVLAILVGGAITAASIGLRYAHAASLSCACALEWSAGDYSRSATAGPYNALIADARPGAAQSFYVMIMNPTRVTQTILGLQYPGAETAEPEQIAVALPGTSTFDDQQDAATRHYTTGTTPIPPHGIRWLRLTVHTASGNLWTRGRQEDWRALYLRVRVGWFDRDETLSFGDSVFVLHGT